MSVAVRKKLFFAATAVAAALLAGTLIRKPALPEKMSYIPSIFASKGMGDKVLQVNLRHDDVQLNSETAEVIAEISMPFSFDEKLTFRWKTGPGVQVIEGALSGEVSGLSAGVTKILRLRVKGFSKQENHHIAFEILGKKNDRSIYGEGFTASDLENTFENTVQNVERIKASQ